MDNHVFIVTVFIVTLTSNYRVQISRITTTFVVQGGRIDELLVCVTELISSKQNSFAAIYT